MPAPLGKTFVGFDKKYLVEALQRHVEERKKGSMEGTAAPSFDDLPLLLEGESELAVSLSDYRGKPLALFFGSYTSSAFRDGAGRIQSIYDAHKGDNINFLYIYPSEAHPTDGWKIESNEKEGISFRRPRTMEEKFHLAKTAKDAYNLTMPIAVDTLDDATDEAYGAMPVRCYVIDHDGIVKYQGKRGPFGFDIDAWEAAIQRALADR
eukprot:CAMPEP_0194047140 /NCGR_PEP_ID=MMETSP0009_2-20130614/23581_1 /TAXON_ID=210454 /ORGANISM="Grammatophora oceanica, Strain CCMP 410" /LENGTH=207 /DNA_ID=CAMNT_0038692667 /DNA_START=237 /DNA_END=860 /DNA_ORIENTATION=-